MPTFKGNSDNINSGAMFVKSLNYSGKSSRSREIILEYSRICSWKKFLGILFAESEQSYAILIDFLTSEA
jgi:hypothetical protein